MPLGIGSGDVRRDFFGHPGQGLPGHRGEREGAEGSARFFELSEALDLFLRGISRLVRGLWFYSDGGSYLELFGVAVLFLAEAM